MNRIVTFNTLLFAKPIFQGAVGAERGHINTSSHPKGQNARTFSCYSNESNSTKVPSLVQKLFPSSIGLKIILVHLSKSLKKLISINPVIDAYNALHNYFTSVLIPN